MSERVSLFRRIINRYREGSRLLAAERQDPAKRFQRAQQAIFAAGVVPLGFMLMLVCANVLAVLINGKTVCDWDFEALLIPVMLAPLWIFCVWVALALKRKRPWARKAAAVLCVAAIAVIVGSFTYLWIMVARLFWTILQDQIRMRAFPAGPSAPDAPYLLFFLVLALATVVQGGACALFGWKCFRAAEYFASDEVKRLCGEMPEAPRGKNP